MRDEADNVLHFWFEEIEPERWWRADPDFDAVVRSRFGDTLRQAAEGALHGWRGSSHGRLAEVLVLDQFSRNVYRGTPRAFAQDGMALVLAQEALARDAHRALGPKHLEFLIMPFMHSESRAVHAQAEVLFRALASAESLEFELRHKAIVDRFGRYPHRNEVLGRVSTAEESVFLREPGSSF
ncbi:MAG: DUF924 domain-containing protein [Xanthomonadales bacterium]|nr:DUF924 domain-containing protein [Xanthomonadales bacterium]